LAGVGGILAEILGFLGFESRTTKTGCQRSLKTSHEMPNETAILRCFIHIKLPIGAWIPVIHVKSD
jgi:hypothetical protein